MTSDPQRALHELYWELTTVCQLACRYCFYETGVSERRRERTGPNHVRALLDSGMTEWFGGVTLTGGEVFFERTLWETVTLLVEAGLRVAIITDGIRLDESARSRIRESGISRLAVSLDSLSPEVHDAVRLPRGDTVRGAATTLDNLRALLDNRPQELVVSVLQTIHRSNIDSIRPMIEWCREVGTDLLVHPIGIPDGSELDDLRLENCTEDEIRNLRESMLEWAGDNIGRVGYTQATLAFLRGVRPSGLTCPMGTSTFFLDSAGNLSPCFHRTDLMYGNVRSEPLTHIMSRLTDHRLGAAPCATLACSCLLECETVEE